MAVAGGFRGGCHDHLPVIPGALKHLSGFTPRLALFKRKLTY